MRKSIVTAMLLGALAAPVSAQTTPLPPARGTTLTGVTSGDYAGETFLPAGDINGDARQDLVISARNYTPTTRQGQIYIIYGQSAGLPGSVSLGAASVKITGLNGGYAGAVVAVGDVNGDNKSDILVNDWAGQNVYVLYGSATLPTTISLSSISTTIPGLKISGIWANAISTGDINKDGKADILIGADSSSNSYVLYGSATLPASLSVAALGSYGATLTAPGQATRFKTAVIDLNKDGFGDIVLSDQVTRTVYVVYGKAAALTSTTLSSTFLNGTNGFKITSNYASFIHPAGDINDDSYPDLAVRGNVTGTTGWRVGFIFGKASFPAAIDLNAYLNGTNGFVINDFKQVPDFGVTISPAGDYNNDAIGDFLVGDPYSGTGRAVLIFGKRTWPSVYSLVTNPINGTQSVQFTGSGFVGASVGYAENLYGGTGCAVDASYLIGAPGYGSAIGKGYVARK